ncbi:MAG: mechanosensitive ion channel [Symploca sp. SIO2G7]|nr:mechanosensitive ion channel [Symploca sp. SIO2G7]
MNQSLLVWGCILIFGFPILTIILGQVGESLKRRKHPLAPFIQQLQRFVLPPLSILAIVRKILGIQEGGIALQILETLLGIAIIYTSLSLLKALLTPGKKEYFWQISVPNLLFQVVRASLVLGIVAYIIANIWNIDLSQAAAALGVGSLVIALALQDTLSNLVSGFLLLADSPFKKGDWIKVGDLTGKVVDMNWRAVRLLTFEEDLLVIPNGALGKQNILNHSQPTPKSWVSFSVSFSRNDPPNRVKEVLHEVYEQITGTVGPAYILTKSFNDFSISYSIWICGKDLFPKFQAAEKFKTRLFYAAKRQGLTIPYPIEYQYISDASELDGQKSTPENQQQLVEYLLSLPYFISVSSQVLTKLVQKTTVEYYGTEEQIIQEGEFVRGFYIIQNGSAKLTIKDTTGSEQEVTRISNGDFFGESVFMSGRPSIVSVTALGDLQLIKIAADAAANLLLENPKFAKQIDESLDERRKAIGRVQRQIDRLTKNITDNGNLGGSSILKQFS